QLGWYTLTLWRERAPLRVKESPLKLPTASKQGFLPGWLKTANTIYHNNISRMDGKWIVSMVLMALMALTTVTQGYRANQLTDSSYPWRPCNSFEATKKNCPLGEACLKLKNFKKYAWNWAMRCQSREEYVNRAEYIYGL
ncbi:hypothetical protein TCAL_17368, partial [Tigriopus californicus]